jgi:hypothetical protein
MLSLFPTFRQGTQPEIEDRQNGPTPHYWVRWVSVKAPTLVRVRRESTAMHPGLTLRIVKRASSANILACELALASSCKTISRTNADRILRHGNEGLSEERISQPRAYP